MRTSLIALISSAGRRVELLNCFREDAAALGMRLELVATDMNPAMSAACQMADRPFQVPRVTDPEFIPRMLELCTQERVALVVPTIDTELQVLAANHARFSAIGARVAISSPEVVRLARNKEDSCRSPAPSPW